MIMGSFDRIATVYAHDHETHLCHAGRISVKAVP
jgi:hypothetical protein